MDPQSSSQMSSNIPPVPEPSPVVVQSNQIESTKPRRHKWIPVLVIGLIFLIILISGFIYWSGKKKTGKQTILPTNTPSTTPPISSSTPISPIISQIGQGVPTTWTTYPDNNFYIANAHFYLSYPQSWKVNYRRNSDPSLQNTSFTRIEFDMLPPYAIVTPASSSGAISEFGWGSMTVDVYPHPNSVQEWINTYFPDIKTKLLALSAGSIGNKQAYVIKVRSDLPTGDPTYASFQSFSLVIGENNSYAITYSQDGQEGFQHVIEQTIWPNIHFD